MEEYVRIRKSGPLIFSIALTLTVSSNAWVETRQDALEEVLVTAQKREQSLQNMPIAISVITGTQLELQAITDLAGMGMGVIPSLRVIPTANTPSNLIIAIRGNGPGDPSEVTREGSVAVYLDGVYIARSQGLGMELADLERVEVLRGPQGSLFGRNAVGGAVSLVSKNPTGEWGVKQTFTAGRFDEFRSITHINFPEFSGISSKFDYLHSEREGWVNNTAPGEADYNEYEKDGGRFSLHWQRMDNIFASYVYDQSRVETAQNYFQFYDDRVGVFGNERDRRSQTRLPVAPLKPTVSDTKGHALTISWDISESLNFKSISAYRDLEEDANNNYAGVLYFNGLSDASVFDQDQITQELQLVGALERLEWIAGVYYLKEEVDKTLQDSFTLDIFNVFGGGALSPITPPTTFDALGSGTFLPPRIVTGEAVSTAIYGQATWNPPLLSDSLRLTLGGRYTEDERSAVRFEMSSIKSDQDSENFDATLAIEYQWLAGFSGYLKWSTAYKAGGVNTRSVSFSPFAEETAETLEVGLKSEFWNNRARLNIAVFNTDHDDLQLDFTNPLNPVIVETINAKNSAEVDGFEVDLTISPYRGLLIGLSYSHLDSDIPLQPNPLDGGVLKRFFIPATPKHAAALTMDYRFDPWRFGVLKAHMNMTSTDDYSYVPFGEQRTDAYSILNARLALTEMDFGQLKGTFSASLWGRNLTDEEYVTFAFPVGEPAVVIAQKFGDPRTVGVDISYQF